MSERDDYRRLWGDSRPLSLAPARVVIELHRQPVRAGASFRGDLPMREHDFLHPWWHDDGAERWRSIVEGNPSIRAAMSGGDHPRSVQFVRR